MIIEVWSESLRRKYSIDDGLGKVDDRLRRSNEKALTSLTGGLCKKAGEVEPE